MADKIPEIFSMIAHELRNHLTLAGARAFNLQKRLEEPENRNSAEQIYSDILAANDMLNNFLMSEEVQEGRFPLPEGRTDIYVTANTSMQRYEERARQLGIELENRIQQTPEKLTLVSSENLERIYNNLIGNALDHASEGTRISLGIENLEDFYQCNVWDNGLGIHPEQRENIFKYGEGGGTGLGLFIVRHIITGYDGEIRLDSKTREEIEKGEETYTNFVFTLPKLSRR